MTEHLVDFSLPFFPKSILSSYHIIRLRES